MITKLPQPPLTTVIPSPAPSDLPRPLRLLWNPTTPLSQARDPASVPFPCVHSDPDRPFPPQRPGSSLVMIAGPHALLSAGCSDPGSRSALSWLLASALLCSGATDFSSAFSPHLSVLLCLWHSVTTSLHLSICLSFSPFLVSFSVLLSILSLSPSLRETSQAQNVETKILW